MLENLFGGKYVEKIIFTLLVNEECYGAQLSKTFKCSVSPVQKALDRLEAGGILVSFLKGRSRFYQFNPRCYYLEELKIFARRAYSCLPKEMKETYYEPVVRRRPRRRGKP